MWDTTGKKDKIVVFDNAVLVLGNENSSNNIVNELMLSANELNIYGKSSPMEFNNRNETTGTGSLLQQIKYDPENAYKTIFKNKLEQLNHRPASPDFYVKPVPK